MKSNAQIISSSFRDPDSAVYKQDGRIFRKLSDSYEAPYRKLMESGLYSALVKKGMLIPHEERRDNGQIVLEPQMVPFISYPYEWCFGQLKDAALLTLDIQLLALDHGMTLKDASAFNVQFKDGKPVFIDTASFEEYREGEPWTPYRQFVQHFMAPLLLMKHVDPELNKMFLHNLDGVPIETANKLLPLRVKFFPGVFLHITLHARISKQHMQNEKQNAKPAEKPKVKLSATAMRGLIEQLRAMIRGLNYKIPETTWSDYYDHTNYTGSAAGHKQELVTAWVDKINPRNVWDLGANTGEYSFPIARRGISTTAFDFDNAAIEKLYRQVRKSGEKKLLPLCMNLSSPSPNIGWHQNERDGLLERGPADLALALALIHHLAIGNNVPLERVADFFAQAADHLIIEMVPKSDSQVQRMLAARKDIFTNYTPEGFERAFTRRFEILEKQSVRETQRVLYLMKAKP